MPVGFPSGSGRRKKADKTRASAQFSRLVTSRGQHNETRGTELDFFEHVRDHEILERAGEINVHSHVYYIAHFYGTSSESVAVSFSLSLSLSLL